LSASAELLAIFAPFGKLPIHARFGEFWGYGGFLEGFHLELGTGARSQKKLFKKPFQPDG